MSLNNRTVLLLMQNSVSKIDCGKILFAIFFSKIYFIPEHSKTDVQYFWCQTFHFGFSWLMTIHFPYAVKSKK